MRSLLLKTLNTPNHLTLDGLPLDNRIIVVQLSKALLIYCYIINLRPQRIGNPSEFSSSCTIYVLNFASSSSGLWKAFYDWLVLTIFPWKKKKSILFIIPAWARDIYRWQDQFLGETRSSHRSNRVGKHSSHRRFISLFCHESLSPINLWFYNSFSLVLCQLVRAMIYWVHSSHVDGCCSSILTFQTLFDSHLFCLLHIFRG